ncbi:MAG: MiaB/RimO family radical SAM methylthiotransferase, partial [Bacteroidota bacterium]
HCSYCTIPLARGRSRNESIAETVKKAAQLGATNIREIVLTGVNTGDFGKSTGETFIELLRAIDNLDNIDRVRISSIEPNLLTDEIIDLVKSSGKFMPHFHVPLQSGCNEILAKMRRRYKRELFAKVVDKIRDRLPDAGIGVDVITGFPGETEEAFLNTFQFIKNLNISYLHVFTYSERKNTGAAIMDGKVSNTEKTRRSKMLLALSDEKRKDFYHKNLGKLHPVLFESKNKNGIMTGFTDNYIKTETPYQPSLINNICPVILKKITDNGNVSGELAKV